MTHIPKDAENRILKDAIKYQDDNFDDGSDYGDAARVAYMEGANAEYLHIRKMRKKELKDLWDAAIEWYRDVQSDHKCPDFETYLKNNVK